MEAKWHSILHSRDKDGFYHCVRAGKKRSLCNRYSIDEVSKETCVTAELKKAQRCDSCDYLLAQFLAGALGR